MARKAVSPPPEPPPPTIDDAIDPPSSVLLALETRAYWEWGASLLWSPLFRFFPKGDGHAVLVFPGFTAGDASTWLLRQHLKGWGYDPYPWNYGVNFGPRRGVLRGCLEHVKELSEQTNRKISLIGWSLGGFYARELAKLAPDLVRFVITLGTPFAGHPKSTHAWRFFELASGQKVDTPEFYRTFRKPPPVPTTSIYSRTDGIVAWHCCVQQTSPIAENIGVCASHLGIGVIPTAMYAIADRLAQPENDWKPFDRTGLKRILFHA